MKALKLITALFLLSALCMAIGCLTGCASSGSESGPVSKDWPSIQQTWPAEQSIPMIPTGALRYAAGPTPP